MQLTPREKIEKLEERILQKFAVFSKLSLGKKFSESPDFFRTIFQVDRDRIIHSRSFRRLAGKTQVFFANYGDHFRSRFSHTIEVAQISRDIARNLGINEDLSEAIALAHDLGHPPFGHAGEEKLNQILQNFGQNFEHNLQSLRIIEFLEEKFPNFSGLNLSFELRDGLKKHSNNSGFLEAQIVNIADEIAYYHHDLDDGFRANFFSISDLRKLKIWKRSSENISEDISEKFYVSQVFSEIIKILIFDLLSEINKKIEKFSLFSSEKIYSFKEKIAVFSKKIYLEKKELKNFLFNKFYKNKKVIKQSSFGQKKIEEIFNFLIKNPEKLPEKFFTKISNKNEKIKIICDFIAGMTDNFATNFLENY